MKFFIEQLAIRPKDKEKAMNLLKALGAYEWASDRVRAQGKVHQVSGTNTAALEFNYELGGTDTDLEFEVLTYDEGSPNWLAEQKGSVVSHFGMHCSCAELEEWKARFAEMSIPIVQEVNTKMHTNPAIKDTRRYTYCIFGTRDILGTDLKFIVRRPL